MTTLYIRTARRELVPGALAIIEPTTRDKCRGCDAPIAGDGWEHTGFCWRCYQEIAARGREPVCRTEPIHVLTPPGYDIPGATAVRWLHGDYSLARCPRTLLSWLRRQNYEAVYYTAYHHPTHGYGNVLTLAHAISPRVRAIVYPSNEVVAVPMRAVAVHLARLAAAAGLFAVWPVVKA